MNVLLTYNYTTPTMALFPLVLNYQTRNTKVSLVEVLAVMSIQKSATKHAEYTVYNPNQDLYISSKGHALENLILYKMIVSSDKS